MSNRSWHASVSASVKTLVGFCCRHGPLGFSEGQAATAEQGQMAQRRVQATRVQVNGHPGYRKEIPVKSTIDAHNITLNISGRIDGAWEEAGTLVLEEIKSTYFHDDTLPSPLFELHQAQAVCYAAMWPDAQRYSSVRIRVTYFQLKDETCFYREIEFSQHEILARYSAWTRDYCAWLALVAEHRQKRDAWAAGLNFPFPQYRRGQRLLAVNAWRYARDHKVAMLEAPTGAGKTISLLFPALKRFSEDPALRVFYLTAKNSGQRTVQQTLARLESGNHLLTVYLSAKALICPCLPANGGSVREPEIRIPTTEIARTQTDIFTDPPISPAICERCTGYFDNRRSAFEAALQLGHLDIATLMALSVEHHVCPHQLALDLCEWADLVVGDFNYMFDPFTRQSLGNAFDEHGLLLIDEAHNLPERARAMYTCTVSSHHIEQLQALKPPTTVRKPLRKLLKQIESPPTDSIIDTTSTYVIPEALPPLLGNVLEAMQLWMEDAPKLASTAPADNLRFEIWMRIFALQRAFEHWGDHYCLMYSQTRTAESSAASETVTQITAYCLDPGYFLAETWQKSTGALLFSGTLQPTEWFAQNLGLQRLPTHRRGEDIAIEHALENTEVKAAVLALPMTYHVRQKSLPVAANHIIALLATHHGRYLVAAASFEILGQLQDALQEHLPDYRWSIQTGDSSPAERQRFLELFTSSERSAALVITGGVFAEGIDLAETPLRGVIQVGLPIPPPSEERKRLQNYYQKHHGQGFEYTYSYPAIARTLQTCGRLLRKNGDRGCLLLIDARFLSPPYDAFLPLHWQKRRVRSIAELIEFTTLNPA